MKVLMIAPQPFFQPRGTPISVLHRLNTLSKLGHEIDLVTYHLGENIPIKNVNYHRMIRLPFVKKIKIGPSKTKIILDVFVILKTLQLLLTKKYDMIHSHEEAGFFATTFAKWFKLPHLYDMHSSLPQQLTNFKFTRLRPLIRMFDKLEENTVTGADAVITICPELYNYVNEHFPQVKQMLIENVADNSTVFSNETAPELSIRETHNVNGEMIILYSGTFEPYQGIDLLIESGKAVVEKHKNVKFLLVGGHADQIASYKAKVADAKLDPYFVFAGQVQPNMVPKYLAASDILVTPRLEGNNTPLKIYEYLRAGKPIIATNHITHTQVLNDDVAALTDVSAESFASGILRVIEDESYRTRIAENAKNLADEKYSYEVYVKKTQAIYSVIEEKLQRSEGD
ncbi:glycosyltransferase family 4 protein [candidate division KSB1 bacterium]|nr:glycosyltransferase family 4 protein [candidate division KSB1 bacterium]